MPDLSQIFDKNKVVELRPKLLVRNKSMIGQLEVHNVKFIPSYSPIRNISLIRCPSCSEINSILEHEIKTKSHYIRDNQIDKIKANTYLRSYYPLNILNKPKSPYNRNHSEIENMVKSPRSLSKISNLEELMSTKSKKQKIEYDEEFLRQKEEMAKKFKYIDYNLEKNLFSSNSSIPGNNEENQSKELNGMSNIQIVDNKDDDINDGIEMNHMNINAINGMGGMSSICGMSNPDHENDQTNEEIYKSKKYFLPNLNKMKLNELSGNNTGIGIGSFTSRDIKNPKKKKQSLQNSLQKLDVKYGLSSKKIKTLKRSTDKKIKSFLFNSSDFYYDNVKKIEKEKKGIKLYK